MRMDTRHVVHADLFAAAHPEGRRGPALAPRILISLGIGLVTGAIAAFLHQRQGFWPDFVFPWEGARQLLVGHDPYQVLTGGGREPFESPLLYPLPAVLAAVPVARLALPVAGAIVMAVSAALLSFALTRTSWDALWALCSAPFVMAVNLGQWSPLVTVAALLPSLGFLVMLKPNLGLAVVAYRPARALILGAAVVFGLTLLVLPRWPMEWLRAVRSLPGHPVPILTVRYAGFLLGLAALKWRTREGRLLLALACVPQLLFFADQLPLLLVARTRRELQAIGFSSLVGFVLWFVTVDPTAAYVPAATPFVLASVYLPALIIVLRRPNIATPPAIEAQDAPFSLGTGARNAAMNRATAGNAG